MRRPTATALRLTAVALLLVVTAGCRGCTKRQPPIHLNPNMDYQAKAQALEASPFFADGSVQRLPVPGTVALEDAEELSPLATGRDAAGEPVAAMPAAARDAFPDFAARGAERYGIYCGPCHGDRGDGQGVMRARGGINSADLRLQRLHDAGDGHLFDVITHGVGLMGSYAAQVPVADRWAIVAHVRALQESQPVTPDVGAAPVADAAAADAAAEPTAEPAAEGDDAPAAAEPMAATEPPAATDDGAAADDGLDDDGSQGEAR